MKDRGLRIAVRAARIAALVLAIVAPLVGQSQSTELHVRFNSGQDVVPVFEGWERVPDGTFNMVFGYMNRNHTQELSIPVGLQNGFDPGPADRGQPTYFYPRENHFLFRVNVPRSWEKNRELVWTIAANGKTEKAKATLLDIWEIDRKVEVSNNGGGGTSVSNEQLFKDEPPKIAVEPVTKATIGIAVTLSATVTDDGIPPPNTKGRGQRKTEPTFDRGKDASPSPVNVPMPERPRPKPGISVWWFVWRGPAGVTFDPEGFVAVKDGKVSVSATLVPPGRYVGRAWAAGCWLRTP